MNFDKQLKSGLKKCPLHKFGADYIFIKYRWYQCCKCKGYYEIDELILGSEPDKEIKIKPTKVGITYEFNEYLGAKINLTI